MLVLDEADRCLEMGFAEQLNAILANLPTERQTLLFSATQTRSIQDLKRCSLKNPGKKRFKFYSSLPLSYSLFLSVLVSADENASKATPEGLTEYYMVCDLDKKLDVLWSFIKNHRKSKILVFMQSCKQVKYTTDLFRRMRVPVQMSALYGTLNQLRRMNIYKEFCAAEKGVLVATDLAARGLGKPNHDNVKSTEKLLKVEYVKGRF